MIVRVWFEDYPQHPIRFVVSTIANGLPEGRKATTSIADACAAVEEALLALTGARPASGDVSGRAPDRQAQGDSRGDDLRSRQ